MSPSGRPARRSRSASSSTSKCGATTTGRISGPIWPAGHPIWSTRPSANTRSLEGVPRVGRLFKEMEAPLSIALNAHSPSSIPRSGRSSAPPSPRRRSWRTVSTTRPRCCRSTRARRPARLYQGNARPDREEHRRARHGLEQPQRLQQRRYVRRNGRRRHRLHTRRHRFRQASRLGTAPRPLVSSPPHRPWSTWANICRATEAQTSSILIDSLENSRVKPRPIRAAKQRSSDRDPSVRDRYTGGCSRNVAGS